MVEIQIHSDGFGFPAKIMGEEQNISHILCIEISYSMDDLVLYFMKINL